MSTLGAWRRQIMRSVLLEGLVLGVGITMLATIIPARRAMAIPPIAAVREGATLPPGRLTRHRWLQPVRSLSASAWRPR